MYSAIKNTKPFKENTCGALVNTFHCVRLHIARIALSSEMLPMSTDSSVSVAMTTTTLNDRMINRV